MSTTAPVSAIEEAPVFFPADGQDLFGVLSRPTGRPRPASVIYLSAGGRLTSLHRDAFPARLGRRLAGEGFQTLRFDFHGAGESTGMAAAYRLDLPFLEDVEGAIRCLKGHGSERHFLVGVCFGARTAVASVGKFPSIAGLALIAPPLGDYRSREGRGVARLAGGVGVSRYAGRGFRKFLRGFFIERRRRKYLRLAKVGVRLIFRAIQNRIRRILGMGRGQDPWLSPDFVAGLEAATRRRIPVLLVFGTEDPFFAHLEAARSGRLGQILARAGSLVEVRTIEGEVQGLTQPGVKDALIEMLVDWLDRRVPPEEPPEVRTGVPARGGKDPRRLVAPDA